MGRDAGYQMPVAGNLTSASSRIPMDYEYKYKLRIFEWVKYFFMFG